MTQFHTYAARGRNAWWRYLLTLVVAPVLVIVISVAVILPIQLAGLWPQDMTRQALDPSHPLMFFSFNGGSFLVVLLAFAGAIALVHRKGPRDIIGAWTWRRFAMGFGLWTVVLLAGTIIDWALIPGSFRWTASTRTLQVALIAIPALAIQTFAEEFVFRGYVTQGLLLATKRMAPTAIISGLMFGALHIPNGWPQAASATLFGVVMAVIAMRTGGLAFTAGLHLINNLFGAVVVVSSADAFKGSPGLFTQTAPSLLWWDAAFGGVALLLAAWAAIRLVGAELDHGRGPPAA
jgi:membrane protease YdiL (CAAX protease family)